MDDLPKENLPEENQSGTSGEIFSSEPESPYQQVISAPEATTSSVPFMQQEGPSQPLYDASSSGFPPSEETAAPPPPYIEDTKKKYIFIAIILIIILVLLVGIIKFIRRKQPAANGNVTLTYWGLWEDKQNIQPIIDEYQRVNSRITINYILQDKKQYRERLQAAIERGEGPDIFRFHNTWVPMLIRNLAPIPKTTLSNEEFMTTFYPVALNDLKIGDNLHGIPLEIDGLLLFYNEDILRSSNVPVPSTWTDIMNAASKLTVKEKGRIITAGIALGTAENIEHFSDILGLMFLQNGVQITNSLFSCSDKTKINCAVDALTFYRTFADPPDNSWDDTLENSILAFAGGRAAMIFAPSWQVFTIKAINSNLNFKTTQVPQLPCDRQPCLAVNWASYWVEGVSNRSKYQQESFEFLKYLSQDSTMKKIYELQVKSRQLFGEPYSRVDLGQSLTDNSYLAPLIAQAPTMKSFYLASRTHDGETGLNTTLIKYLQDAVNSLSAGVSPETALHTADAGFKQIFTRFGITSSL